MLMKLLRIRHLAFAAPLGLALGAAQAQTVAVPDAPESGINLSLGALAVYTPSYEGARSSRARVFPSVVLSTAGGGFISGRLDAGWNFSKDESLDYGLIVAPALPQEEKDDPALRGMGDIGWRATAGAFVTYRPNRMVSVRSAVRYGMGRERDGATVATSVGVGYPIMPGRIVSASVGALWANQSYMRSYFGVTPEQAARTGYRVYTPGSGLVDTRLTLSTFGGITRDWGYFVNLTASRLQGDAKDGPLVLERTQTSALVGLNYRFR
jgi:MipA family protein